MSDVLDDDAVAHLLRRLPPAPDGWVDAARELPRARRAVEEMDVAGAGDVAAALRAAGHDPTPALLAAVRHVLGDLDGR